MVGQFPPPQRSGRASAHCRKASAAGGLTPRRRRMSETIRESEFLPGEATRDAALADPSASPFKLVVDPEMRMKLRRALLEIVETHDEELAKYVSEGMLS